MRNAAIIIIVTALYAIIAELSEYLAIPGTIVSPVWPPAGIALAATLIYGNVALIGVFLGCFIGDFHLFTGGGNLWFAILNAAAPGVGAALQAYVGKLALKLYANTYNIFNNTRSVLTFILISAFAACLINTTFGTTTLMLTGNLPISQFPYAWLTWWIADAVGVITITSTIIAWNQKWQEKISILQMTKLAITWGLILIVGLIALQREVQLAYLFIPFAIWAAFQFEIRFSLLTGLLISSICLYDVVHGYSIIQINSVNISIILIQIYIGIIFLTILLTHTILTERQKAYENLQSLNLQLEKRILDRTKDLSESNHQLEIQKNKAIEAFEALKQSHARLMQSEKMASLGVLTAGVAHEIKNPLNAMSANMESIKKNIDHIVESIPEINTDENAQNNVKNISDNTGSLIEATNEGIKRTAGIIADLCAFARADEPEMIMTDLHQNIDSTLNLLSSEIKNNIKVIKEYGDIPPILCHPGKLNQVIMNILINAIHALQTKRNSQIIIKTTTNDGTIALSIKDNGIGIKKEILEKIFSPFFTTKQSGFGSGLGLFISYNIIREHNGTITVNSEPEKGTEFIITLPIREH